MKMKGECCDNLVPLNEFDRLIEYDWPNLSPIRVQLSLRTAPNPCRLPIVWLLGADNLCPEFMKKMFKRTVPKSKIEVCVTYKLKALIQMPVCIQKFTHISSQNI